MIALLRGVCLGFLFFLAGFGQNSALALAQTEHRQVKFSKWGIGTANYSGITSMGGDCYAVVSDKEPTDGYFVFEILQDSITGKVTNVELKGFRGNPAPNLDAGGFSMRDTEGIAWFPPAQTCFISGEGDQQILEYDNLGMPTGRRLTIPQIFARDKIVGNYGFEALTYSPETSLFWTTTEAMLPADGIPTSPEYPDVQNLLRLQAFDADLQPVAQYAYRMDKGKLISDKGKGPSDKRQGGVYAMGVTALAALPCGDLLVLEREVNITKRRFGSKVICKVFQVSPDSGWQIDSSTKLSALDPNKFLKKKLIADFSTVISPFRFNLANYEGMCLGRKLADGRQTILLVNDSQASSGRRILHLKDYIKVLISDR